MLLESMTKMKLVIHLKGEEIPMKHKSIWEINNSPIQNTYC